jgi:cytoskeletal protein CcmA (bactofilin family)
MSGRTFKNTEEGKMSNEIKRINYFNGLLLKEDDLTLEQDYHIKLQRLHNRFFHEWGIVDGLEVAVVPNSSKVTVSSGLALNRIKDEETGQKLSQEIWVYDGHPDSEQDLSTKDADRDYYVILRYKEEPCDIDSTKGGSKEIHIWERAEITVENAIPSDPSKEIILACVTLDGNKVAVLDETKNKGLRTCAVTAGTAKEFQKVIIGEKDKLNLPFITGLSDTTLGLDDGLEVDSPYTKFDGKLISGDLNTKGNVTVDGALSVNSNNTEVFSVDSKGTVSITRNASVGGTLSSKDGLIIEGSNTTLDTDSVILSGNMLTINKYTLSEGEEVPKNSGIEVYRGETLPNAKLVWDTDENVWKAGTDKVGEGEAQQGGLYSVAYGTEWETMKGGLNADKYHNHSKIADSLGKTALNVDANNNVEIVNALKVNGNLVASNGIEVPSGTTAAKLMWNENDKHWQIGIGTEMFNLPYGESWETLTTGTNADTLHTHSEFFSSNGQVAMSASPSGDLVVSSNLEVAKNLTVDGNLKVNGTQTVAVKMLQEVAEKVIVVNKPESADGQPAAEGGLEVYRGGTLPNARLIWDEGSDSWKIGTENGMFEIPGGIEWEYLTHGGLVDDLHKHDSLCNEDGTVAVAVDKNGDVEAEGNVTIDGELSVEDDAKISGDLTVAGSLTLDGNLNITGKQTVINKKTVEVDDRAIIVNKYTGISDPLDNEGGLEVYRGGIAQNARIVWSESKKTWRVGIGTDLRDIPSGKKWDELTNKALADELHIHSKLCDNSGNSIISINTDGDVSIEKDTTINGALSVDGSLIINGDIDVIGTPTFTNKVDMQVVDNVVLLNKFEGTSLPVNESGIEIYRGADKPKARLMWDEAMKIWKAGIGDQLNEIASGVSWEKLTKLGNADALHHHGQLYNEKGDILALSSRASGNVDVKHDLSVGQDLTILGNLDVRGGLTRIESNNIEVMGNTILINKFDSGNLPVVKSGLTVFRGNNEQGAVMVWDEAKSEADSCWKIGLSSSSSGKPESTFLKVGTGGIDTTGAVLSGSLSAESAKINGKLVIKDSIQIDKSDASIKWREFVKAGTDKISKQWEIGTGLVGISVTSDGKVGIANSDPQQTLDVSGNTNISGNIYVKRDIEVTGKSTVTGELKAGSANVTGKLTAGSEDVTGKLTAANAEIKDLTVAGNIAMAGSIEVKRQKDGSPAPSAKIAWDEVNGVWTFGVADKMEKLILTGQNNQSLFYTGDGKALAICISTSKDPNGFVGIGTNSPNAKLDVNGDAVVSGKISGDSITVTKLISKSSFDVYRGNDKPAKLYWDSINNVWQAGIEGSLMNISLNGHKHSNLYTAGGTAALNVASSGNIGVGKDIPDAKLDVAGNLKATAIEVAGNLNANTLDVTGYITSSSLITGKTANITESAEIAKLNVRGNLTAESAHINTNLTVDGNLTVNGEVVSVNTATLDVEDNIVTINKYQPQAVPVNKNAGLDVFRGGTAPNAQIIWNESLGVWQAGLAGVLSDIEYKGHKHQKLYTINDAEALTVDSSGNIGIGTALPTSRLDINGKLTATAADINGTLTVKTGLGITGSDNAQIVWNSTKKTWQAGFAGVLSDIEYKGHKHQKLYTINDAEALTVDSSGNIGIGTAAPLSKLDINGKLTATAADINGTLTVKTGLGVTGSDNAQIVWNSTKKTWQAGFAGVLSDIEYQGHKHHNLYCANDAEALTVDSNGNIGIGTVTPSSKLDINGKLTATAADINGTLTVKTGLGITGSDNAQLVWNSTKKTWQAGSAGVLSDIEYQGHKHQKLHTSSGTEAVTVDSDGNVGIGKTPATGVKLDVAGNIMADNIAEILERLAVLERKVAITAG